MIAGQRVGPGDRVVDRVAGRQQRREGGRRTDYRGVGTGDGFGGVVANLVSGRVRGEIRASLEPVGRTGRDAHPCRELDGHILRRRRLRHRGVEDRAQIGWVVRLREVELDLDPGRLVGLRGAALNRLDIDAGVEQGGEIVASGHRRGDDLADRPDRIAEVGEVVYGIHPARVLPAIGEYFPFWFGFRTIDGVGQERRARGARSLVAGDAIEEGGEHYELGADRVRRPDRQVVRIGARLRNHIQREDVADDAATRTGRDSRDPA